MRAVVLDGIVIGLAFGLLGVGMTLVYGLGGVINLAYGQMVVVGAIAASLVIEDGHSQTVAAVVGVLAAVGVSLLLGLYDTLGKLNHVGFSSTIKDAERAALEAKVRPYLGGAGFSGKVKLIGNGSDLAGLQRIVAGQQSDDFGASASYDGFALANALEQELAGDTITGTYQAAHQVFADLAAAGVDFADVTQVLEDEGVSKFIASWHDLQGTVNTALQDALQATR